MRKHRPLWLLPVLTFFVMSAAAQNVGIGTTFPDKSAQLDISSGTRGILIPRMTTAAVSAAANPAKGLMIYDSIRNQLMVNMGTPTAPDWENIIANCGWGLSGNAVTANGAAIGTTTPFDLHFVVGSTPAGVLDSSFGNTSFGYGAVSPNDPTTTANQATTAVGFQALANNEELANSAFGFQALFSNIGGSVNTAVGASALTANFGGSDNSACGFSALGNNSNGNDNTGVGYAALFSNLGGFYNTAVGSRALQVTTNSYYNTAIGYLAGTGFNNGYNNVFVGANTDVNGAGYFNDIAIGQATICTASSQVRFGNTATNSIGGFANWTNFSDGRYKKNMKEDVVGLDFILRLHPFTYNLDVAAIQGHLKTGGQGRTNTIPRPHGLQTGNAATNTRPAADPRMQQAMTDRETETLSGFSAQEVEKAAQASGYTFSGVDKPKNADDFYGLRYSDFVVPLVKGMQEQQQLINTLTKRLDDLEKENRALIALLNTKK